MRHATAAKRHEPRAIVDDRTFILATRDTGYRDVAAAVAELIDNSLQAEANDVQVFVIEGVDQTDGRTEELPGRSITMAVVDDGYGMGPETLRKALQFGGTNRFDDRTGFGRFGMGLPNSSVSQTRRLEVYSWQDGGTPFYSYLDVDEIASGRLRAIPAPERRQLPTWLSADIGANGTAVLWSRCDRLGRLRANTIAQRLQAPLGRMYRYAIWAGSRLRVNSSRVRPIDPLFLRGAAPLNEAMAYGSRLRYEFADPDTGRTSFVEIQFSELPVARWQEWSVSEKRRCGIVGGAGVSIVRAGREIDYGWHLMGGKRRENYDDWWRCEIHFSPALDELFGVTHSKQGISPKLELRTTLGPDLEAIARTLNSRARAAFEALKATTLTPATKLASATDQFLDHHGLRATDRIGGLKYHIDVSPLASPAFYAASIRAGVVTLTINQDHPFCKKFYEPACAPGRTRERFALECLLLAAARADVTTFGTRDEPAATRLRTSWADTLAALLDGL